MLIPNKYSGYVDGVRRYNMDSGGSSSSPTQQSTTVSELPEWAKPYAQKTLAKAEALTDQPYQTYNAPRIQGFTGLQQRAQEQAAGMGPASQLGTATGLASAVGLGAMGTQYQPGEFQSQFRAPDQYTPSQFAMLQAQAPQLTQFQMGGPERVRTGSFTRPGTAEAYMSPYIEQAIAPQLREAQRASDILGTQQAGQAVRSGAFGGSRAGLLEAERERNLATQMGDIRARGLQSAYEQAQQLYGTEQQRALQAALANQQAGLQVGGQNLQALLGVQQLGAGQNLQAQLANQQMLQAAQQAAEQSRQFGAGQGLQAAGLGAQYGQAAQQLGEQSRQFGANLGMQGLTTGLQAAGQLGQLGQTQYGQEMGINQLLNQYGAQQQALQQQGLTQAYQDFLNQQNYPYKQLGFMSDLIRGLPLGQQSAQQIYQAPPTALQTVGSLGLGAYGLKQLGMFADGGVVGYAGDEGSVTSERFVKGVLDDLSDPELAEAERIAIMTNDQQRLDDIAEEKATRASERGGMAGAYNALPSEYQDSIVRAANGGIVAFANGGVQRYNQKGYVLSDTPGFVEGEDSDMRIPIGDLYTERDDESPGNAGLQADFANMFRTRLSRIDANQGYIPMTRAERRAAENEAYQDFVRAAGPDIYQPAIQRLNEADTARGQALEEAKGFGALQAMQAITQPGGFIRGLGGAGAAFGATMAKAKEADRAEKRYINQMQLSLADAKRKESLGLFKEARADVRDSEIAGLNAAKARQLRDTNVLNAVARMTQATRPAAQKAPPGQKEFEFGVAQYLPMVKEQFPDLTPAQQNAKAFQIYQERRGAGLAGVETRVEASAEEKARERAAKRAFTDPELLAATRKKDTAGAAARRAAILQEELGKPAPGAGAGQTGGITPDAFNAKWATLKSGESLVGPDGKTYTKK